jgi:hypothetical protein
MIARNAGRGRTMGGEDRQSRESALKSGFFGWLAVLAITGCASSHLIAGWSYLNVSSNPPGAFCELKRAGATIGLVTTPGGDSITPSKDDITLICKKDGYEDATAVIHPHLNPALLGNLALLYLAPMGFVQDLASGAGHEYPERIDVTLVPVTRAKDNDKCQTNDECADCAKQCNSSGSTDDIQMTGRAGLPEAQRDRQ